MRQQLLSCGQVMAGLVEPQSKPLVTERPHQAVSTVVPHRHCRPDQVRQEHPHQRLRAPAEPLAHVRDALDDGHHQPQLPSGLSEGCAARFKFMQRGEWDEIAQGRGELRELTKRLVPDFEPNLLQRQAVRCAARERKARRRIRSSSRPCPRLRDTGAGPARELRLLGRAHGPEVGRQVFRYHEQRGSLLPERTVRVSGHVTDTPGVNDPFLIRDEITRRSLGTADVYIAVLTAPSRSPTRTWHF